MAKIKEDLLRVQDEEIIGDWHFVKAKSGKKIRVVAKDFANNVSKKELVLRADSLKLKEKDSLAVPLDTLPPNLGKIYLKTDFAGKVQCRIPVLDSLSGLDFDSVDFRDKNGKWVIFDYHYNSKELVVEKRDFDFSEHLNIKLCDKAKNCREENIKCE